MIDIVVRRLVGMVPVLIGVSLITFALIQIIPGDAAVVIAGPDASTDQVEAIREVLGLDRPLHVQLGIWYWNLLQGDLGDSFLLGRSVTQAIMERLPVTMLLTTYSILLTMPLGVAAGLIAAYRQNTWVDTAVMSVALVGVSVPSFWLSVMGILLFPSRSAGCRPAVTFRPRRGSSPACARSPCRPYRWPSSRLVFLRA